jgi:hypothetical protein
MTETGFAEELARRQQLRENARAQPDVLPASHKSCEPATLVRPEPEPIVPVFSPASVAGLIPYTQVPRTPTIYLAREPIALTRGGVVVLAGPGGYGKGTSIADLAARVTRGELLLGGRPGSVLWCGYEDRQDETMSWRLDAAGADGRFVFDITDIPGHGKFGIDASDSKTPDSVPVLAAKINALADAARRGEISGVPGEGMPVLVVIDPLFKAISGGTIRQGDGPGRVMAKLDKVARTTGVTIVLPHHMNWGGKIGGGVGIVDSARLVYIVEREDAEAGVYALRPYKANGVNLDTAAAARYQIVGAGKQAHVIWLPPETTNAGSEYAWRVEAMDVLPPEAFEGEAIEEPEPPAIEAGPAAPPPSPYTGEPPVSYAESDAIAEAELVPPMIKAEFRKGGQEYTYSVHPDQAVEVGDRVRVVTPKGRAFATVTQIGSDYTGTPNPVLFVQGKPAPAGYRESIDSVIKELGGTK